MEFCENSFLGGVESAFEIQEAERARLREARGKCKELIFQRPEKEEEFQAALDEVEPRGPLWRQITGFTPENELSLSPAERRGGIRRLLRVVERMFRDELKSEDVDCFGGASRLSREERSYAGRSALWDPLHEICLYLEISKTKLTELCLQRTGLRAVEVGDCIRAEGLRTFLREKFRPLMKTWLETMEESARGTLGADMSHSAWRFLKWMRGGGRGETRKKLSLEMGMTSRERLERATFLSERDTVEALELAVASALICEMTEAPGAYRGVPSFLRTETSHGAELDEVVPPEKTDETAEEGGDLEGDVRAAG